MPDTSLGITYPASTSHTRIWEHVQAVADDVNTILTNRTPLRGSAALSSLYTLTATMTDLTGASVTINVPTANAVYLASWSGDFQVITAGVMTGVLQLVVDGVAASPQALWSPVSTAAARNSTANSVTGVLAASGSHTFKLQANAVITSGSARLNNIHTQLSVLVLPL